MKLGSLTVVMRTLGALLAVTSIGLFTAGQAVAKTRTLRAPRLQAPGNGASVASLPAFTWGGVGGAATYQFEFSADPSFSSGVSGFGNGPISLNTTAVTNDKAIPNGTYYWRVRGVSATDRTGRWSPKRTLHKEWTAAPALQSPLGATVDWPSQPLRLQWSSVPGAVSYDVYIATDPGLSHLVLGSINSPFQVQGPQYAFPDVLAPGIYYWAIQPVDAEGYRGVRSGIGTFTWAWPSNTSVTETNVSPDSSVEEPSLSWTPIAGASGYEVQVATDPTFPTNSTILDDSSLVSNSYNATRFFPNHTTLYWRVRARDANHDAGNWNQGQPFMESFDLLHPSIQNLHVVDQSGTVVDGTASDSDPIVRWSPVPGASFYKVTLAPYDIPSGGTTQTCDYNSGKTHVTATPTTAWTPVGSDANFAWANTQYGWSAGLDPGGSIALSSGAWCVSVIAVRDDSPLAGPQIASEPAYVLSPNQAAFTYVQPSPSGSLGTTAAYSPGLIPPAAGSPAVSQGATLTTSPLFEWQQVSGADGYYVVVSNDQFFDPNAIVAVGYTNTTAYVPQVSIPDQTGDYWWEVIPVTKGGEPLYNVQDGSYQPEYFQKASNPPSPVSPVGGVTISRDPVFSWGSAQGAARYELQVAGDSTFANPLLDVTTDSTSYTPTTTLPAGKTLFWRVRAIDHNKNELNWSAIETFTHQLPVPSPSSSNPTSGSTIPLLSWTPVTGAESYNMFVVQSDGSTENFSLNTPEMTPTLFYGTGIWHWQVQAVYPGGTTSAYFSPAASYLRTIPAPTGLYASKSGSRIVISWSPDSVAKQYRVQLSTTDGFSSPVASDTTDNTVWVPQIAAQVAGKKLYWRVAAVDRGGNVGSYASGIFNGPHHKKHKKHKKHKHKKRCKHGRTKSGKCKK